MQTYYRSRSLTVRTDDIDTDVIRFALTLGVSITFDRAGGDRAGVQLVGPAISVELVEARLI